MERTKQIDNWYELVEFIEAINPHKETIVLSGWVNEVQNEKVFIKTLVFTTKPVDILKEKKEEVIPEIKATIVVKKKHDKPSKTGESKDEKGNVE